MVSGHLALGLAANGRRPTLPLGVCLLAACWPDLIMGGLGVAGVATTADAYSHSLPAVVLWAVAAALWVGAAHRNAADGLWTGALVAIHLPSDWVTSRLALWPGGPVWGAGLYAHPVADLLLETALAVGGWALYRTGLPDAARHRWLAWAPLAVLVALQGVWAALSWQ